MSVYGNFDITFKDLSKNSQSLEHSIHSSEISPSASSQSLENKNVYSIPKNLKKKSSKYFSTSKLSDGNKSEFVGSISYQTSSSSHSIFSSEENSHINSSYSDSLGTSSASFSSSDSYKDNYTETISGSNDTIHDDMKDNLFNEDNIVPQNTSSYLNDTSPEFPSLHPLSFLTEPYSSLGDNSSSGSGGDSTFRPITNEYVTIHLNNTTNLRPTTIDGITKYPSMPILDLNRHIELEKEKLKQKNDELDDSEESPDTFYNPIPLNNVSLTKNVKINDVSILDNSIKTDDNNGSDFLIVQNNSLSINSHGVDFQIISGYIFFLLFLMYESSFS
jgi:hypothetical protein